jgi:hypothetical protein
MQKNAVAVAPPAAHIGSPRGAARLIYFDKFAFDRVGTLWQCRAGETLLNLKWERKGGQTRVGVQADLSELRRALL